MPMGLDSKFKQWFNSKGGSGGMHMGMQPAYGQYINNMKNSTTRAQIIKDMGWNPNDIYFQQFVSSHHHHHGIFGSLKPKPIVSTPTPVAQNNIFKRKFKY
jgi:hypothetical protein